MTEDPKAAGAAPIPLPPAPVGGAVGEMLLPHPERMCAHPVRLRGPLDAPVYGPPLLQAAFELQALVQARVTHLKHYLEPSLGTVVAPSPPAVLAQSAGAMRLLTRAFEGLAGGWGVLPRRTLIYLDGADNAVWARVLGLHSAPLLIGQATNGAVVFQVVALLRASRGPTGEPVEEVVAYALASAGTRGNHPPSITLFPGDAAGAKDMFSSVEYTHAPPLKLDAGEYSAVLQDPVAEEEGPLWVRIPQEKLRSYLGIPQVVPWRGLPCWEATHLLTSLVRGREAEAAAWLRMESLLVMLGAPYARWCVKGPYPEKAPE